MEKPSSNDGDGNFNSCSWSSATNWTIAGGSLNTSITFESSDSPIDSETVDVTGKPFLLLKPPSPDCGSCEINIIFPQKHEVRQVYVRSTARVFEIYSAPSLRCTNEYLCTVRCGIAARDDVVLHARNAEEPAAEHSDGSVEKHVGEKCSIDGNSASSEDDWVEVKVPDSPLQESPHKSKSEMIDENLGMSIQDFYEATAEITDADACISITLRLLSLQSKGCILVDEIYIFAEPVESADSETQPSQVGNSAGSSLMAMLVPTLLQLSKTGNNQKQETHPNSSEKGEYLEVGSRRVTDLTDMANEMQQEEGVAAQQDVKLQQVNKGKSLQVGTSLTNSTDIANAIQLEDSIIAQQDANLQVVKGGESLEVGSRITGSTYRAHEIHREDDIAARQGAKLQEVNEATPQLPEFQIPAEFSAREKIHLIAPKTNMPYDPIERALEQLVSRVSKIEDICSRFEENMLKPINSMEARLERVEKQVEMLAKNHQYPGLPSYTRISAPAFSCSGSNSSSFYGGGSDYPACGAQMLEKEDIPSDELSNPPDDLSVSVNDTRFLPGLVVTAPEFSCGDDEESNDALELPDDCPLESTEQALSTDKALPGGCPQEITKQSLSLDDALAAALAGFLSTTSVQPSHYTQVLTVKAPEFTIEDHGEDDIVVSPNAQSKKLVCLPFFFCKSDAVECINDSTSSMLGTRQVMVNFGDHCFKETHEGFDGHDQLDEVGFSCRSLVTNVNCKASEAKVALVQRDDCQIAESTCREISNGFSVPISERNDILQQFAVNQIEHTSNMLHESAASSDENVEESGNEMLQTDFKSSSASGIVDFELPILDVKFASLERSRAMSAFEELLTDLSEYDDEAPCSQPMDVKFASLESSRAMSSFEELLTDMSEYDDEAACSQPMDDVVIGAQSSLILPDDGELSCPLVEWDTSNVKDVPSGVEDENSCIQQRDDVVIGAQSSLIFSDDGDLSFPMVDWDSSDVKDTTTLIRPVTSASLI